MTATTNRRAPGRKPAEVTFKAPVKKAAVAQQRSKPASTPPVQEPLVQDDHPRPTHHNGVEIDREERVASPLGGFFRVTRLHLTNGVMAFGCWDCLATADSRGELMGHRNAEHGARYIRDNKTRLERLKAKDPDLFTDLILPDREDGARPGDRATDWTLGEIMAVVPTIQALGDHLEEQEQRIAELTEQLKETRVSKADQHKIDVYESNQNEIIELRAQVRQWSGYEKNKEELHVLRAWKRKTITRLNRAGIQLSEED